MKVDMHIKNIKKHVIQLVCTLVYINLWTKFGYKVGCSQ